MRTIDITLILGPDLKSRIAVQDVLQFVKNTGDNEVEIDFSKVQFATRSFMDEFYNTFVAKNCAFSVSLSGMPEDIAYMLKVVSSTQNKPKNIETAGEVTYCSSLEDLQECLATI